MTEFILSPRRNKSLVVVALLIGVLYVGLTFDLRFLAGHGPFWDYPVGPWLGDSGDTQDNADILDYLVAYTGSVRSPWSLPLFHVAAIGAPAGTSVVFLDVIPIAALIGRIASTISGVFLLPYGAWIGLCFILAPAFATLMVAEAGQRSLLAAIAASIFAVSAPTLLHRFGHLPLLAHFLITGSYYLYFREQDSLSRLKRYLFWAVWSSLALLTNPYMFAMVGAIYVASLIRSWRLHGLKSRLLEPAFICGGALILLFELGFIGSGATLSGEGYGVFSMNVLSPFVPQRSGIFPSMHGIIDATGGQYEGFNYLGLGGLVLLLVALMIDPPGLRYALSSHRELAILMVLLSCYAVSNNIWVGDTEVANIEIGSTLTKLSAIYRSSGRMFWPVYYILILGSLIFILNRVGRLWLVPIIGVCCVVQLIDSEPLRARMTTLTNHGGTPLLDQAEWSHRIAGSDFVEIHPTFFCSQGRQRLADIELQLLAIRVDRSFNVSYNPRLRPECEADAKRLVAGPWRPTTLYVLFDGSPHLPKDWAPAGFACATFSEGKWCLGHQQGGQGALQ